MPRPPEVPRFPWLILLWIPALILLALPALMIVAELRPTAQAQSFESFAEMCLQIWLGFMMLSVVAQLYAVPRAALVMVRHEYHRRLTCFAAILAGVAYFAGMLYLYWIFVLLPTGRG